MPNATPTTAAPNRAPPAPAVPPAWPADVPSEDDADGILCAAIAGLRAAGDPALATTLDALTALERDALTGELRDPAPGPLRRAATLRYRLAAALAGAPRAGAPVDAEAGRALLAAIDEALAAVAALDAGARAREVDAIRRALVKDAVDLSERLQRLSPADAGDAAAGPTPPRAPAARVTTARVLAVDARSAAAARRRTLGLGVALGVVVLGAGAFWTHRLVTRPPPPAFPTLPGLPEAALGYEASSGARLVVSGTGKSLPPADVDALRLREAAAGRTVRELAPGVYVSSAAGPQGSAR